MDIDPDQKPFPVQLTLIELLVVISIISLLLAAMLSGLQAARWLARRVTCSANLRSLVFAALMYASDNGERLLVKDEGMHPCQLDLGWQQQMNRGHPDLRDMFQGYLSGFEKTVGPSPLIFCPAARPWNEPQRGSISFESGSTQWKKGHYVIGYPNVEQDGSATLAVPLWLSCRDRRE